VGRDTVQPPSAAGIALLVSVIVMTF